MQSLLILPLQRERARRRGGSGVCHRILRRENSNTLDIRGSYGEVILQEGRGVKKFMRADTAYTYTDFKQNLVWLARPSHLIAGALRAGRDGLAAVKISSHLSDQSDATGRNSC